MILRTLICVLAPTLFCGTGVQAQVVTVRGGNHDGFSRLVFYFQAGREWSLQKTDTGHLLSIDLESLGLRLSEVFEKIGRDKVTGITADRNRSTILIQTGCDCTLKAALLRPGMLVVDVHDAPVISKLAQLTFVQGEILNGQIGKFGAPKAVPNGKSPEFPKNWTCRRSGF